jgi:hypothetical protein
VARRKSIERGFRLFVLVFFVLSFFRLARRRSPKPRGFGAGEVRRKLGMKTGRVALTEARWHGGRGRVIGYLSQREPHLSGMAVAAGSFFVSRVFAPASGSAAA